MAFTNLGKLGKGTARKETIFWKVLVCVFPALPPIKFKHFIPETLAPVYK